MSEQRGAESALHRFSVMGQTTEPVDGAGEPRDGYYYLRHIIRAESRSAAKTRFLAAHPRRKWSALSAKRLGV